MQVDSPQKLYNEPNNLFVAGFIGSPQMNFIDTKCKVEGDKVSLTFDNTTIVLPPAKAKKLADELKTMLDKEQLFIGFKARHRFRANNNAGQIVFGEMKYLFDKDMNKIVASYDMDDDEYKTVQIVYKQMLGEDVQIEGENFDDDEVLEE